MNKVRRLSQRLRQASGRWTTLLALAAFLLFTALVLPGQSAQSETVSGGAGSPDMSFLYTAGDLYRMAEAYGQQGREAYIRARFTFDVVWPLVYVFFLTTAISWLNARAFTAESAWQFVNLVPALGGVLDYAENLSTSLVMFRYPSRTPVVDGLAPVFTALKWSVVGMSFAFLLIGIGAVAWKWIRGRERNT